MCGNPSPPMCGKELLLVSLGGAVNIGSYKSGALELTTPKGAGSVSSTPP